MIRHFSVFDRILNEVDVALRTICVPEQRAVHRASPADALADAPMTTAEKRHVAGLMRVNHAGEVCAQALYQAQALSAKVEQIQSHMVAAAGEEIDHLGWCESRLWQLDASPSLLNPLWYSGSFLLGMIAGLAGDRLSLGFVAETERQVSLHLQAHLKRLPTQDQKTRAILAQMETDESKHAAVALEAGAAQLPGPVCFLMRYAAKCLTLSSYYV
jgi:ubiquinone biosynthesis monooxygenase Coq7